MSSLQTRLQDPDYLNWVKAGLCLIHTKSVLEEFAEAASQSLHQSILKNIVPTYASAAQPICGVNIARQKLIPICSDPYCQNFIKEVINNGFDPNHAFTVNRWNLGNCDTGQWHSHHWQVAKLFMNNGQEPAHVHPKETDMSGIINFLSHCKIPRNAVTNIGFFGKVRDARNKTMHSAVMKLSAGDLQTYAQSMIDLLSDPGVAKFTTAQDAVTEIQSIINAADFKISLEDESKVIDDLAAEIRTLTEEIRQEVDAVAQKGDAERQAMKEKLDEEIKKVSSLKDMVEQIAGTQSQIKDTVTVLTDQLKDLRTFKIELNEIQQTLSNLTTSQEMFHETVEELKTKQSETGHELHDLRTELDTSRTQTKQDIEEVKAMQEDYQRQTNQRFDDQTTTGDPIPTDEDIKRLRDYLQKIYKDSEYSIVTPLPDWVELHVRDIFTPVILVGDRKGDKKQRLESYKELFHKEGVKQKRIMLLGEAGAGKTTFCQHLVDVWCNPSSRRQFDDVDIIKQLQFLFYISCRFAESHETVLNMIENQLFDDEKSELRDIAHSVLRHNAEGCLILMDGFDELQRSAQAKTGKRGDITGMPSLTNIQNCTLVTTSRPWKFLSIPNKEQEKFRRLQLDGIKDLAELVKTMFQEQQVEDPAKLCTDFLDAIKERELSELMKFPIMLIFAIDVWVENGSLPTSVSLCYINMICLAVCRSARKREEANVKSKSKAVDKLLNRYLKYAKFLPNPLSNFECLKQNAGLLLNLGQLAYDFLLQPNGQTLVFQMDDCKKYNIHKLDGSLEYCLDLGLLIKVESTVKVLKQKENFEFCHKTYQEFFAALWLSYRYSTEGSQEMSYIQSCIKSREVLINHGVLIHFLCGLCPEAGTELWKYVAQNIRIDHTSESEEEVQYLILRAVKEARDCCYHQGDQVYYCTPVVVIDEAMTDEDVSLLCKMIQNNSCYLKHVKVSNERLSTSQYHSMLRSALSAIELEKLWLIYDILCQANDSSEDLPVLDLSNHCRLKELVLYKISISGLVLPSQGESQLGKLYLYNLVLPHDDLVNLCSSLSSVKGIRRLRLTRLSCKEHQDGCSLPVLDLSNYCTLNELILCKISISGLMLFSQEWLQLIRLYLDNLSLSHDNLVRLCSVISSVSSVSSIEKLQLTHVRCSNHDVSRDVPTLDLPKQESDNAEEEQILDIDVLSLSGLDELKLPIVPCSGQISACTFTVLDLHRYRSLQELKLDSSSISGILLPSEDWMNIEDVVLCNLVLSHYSLEQLPRSLSSLPAYVGRHLVNLSCSDHGGSCSLPSLYWPDTELQNIDTQFEEISDSDSSDDASDSDKISDLDFSDDASDSDKFSDLDFSDDASYSDNVESDWIT